MVQNEYVWEVMDGFGGVADKQVHKMKDEATRDVAKEHDLGADWWRTSKCIRQGTSSPGGWPTRRMTSRSKRWPRLKKTHFFCLTMFKVKK